MGVDPATGQYYYHAFLKEQPDLNWRNPEVRDAMHDVMRFWLDRGVDGFRVDVIWHLIKDGQDFATTPSIRRTGQGRPEIERLLQVHSADQPEVHEVIAQMRRQVERYPGPCPHRRNLPAAQSFDRLLRGAALGRASPLQFPAHPCRLGRENPGFDDS